MRLGRHPSKRHVLVHRSSKNGTRKSFSFASRVYDEGRNSTPQRKAQCGDSAVPHQISGIDSIGR